MKNVLLALSLVSFSYACNSDKAIEKPTLKASSSANEESSEATSEATSEAQDQDTATAGTTSSAVAGSVDAVTAAAEGSGMPLLPLTFKSEAKACDIFSSAEIGDQALEIKLTETLVKADGTGSVTVRPLICSLLLIFKVPANHRLEVTPEKELRYSATVGLHDGSKAKLTHRLNLVNVPEQTTFVTDYAGGTRGAALGTPSAESAKSFSSKCSASENEAILNLDIRYLIQGSNLPARGSISAFYNPIKMGMQIVPCNP